MILKKINNQKLQRAVKSKQILINNFTKKFLYTKRGTGFSEESTKQTEITLDNIFDFNPRKMKITQNKIILNQVHLGLKPSKNDTYVIYQTEESNGYLLCRKLLFFGICIILIALVQKYKREGISKYIIFTLLAGTSLVSLLIPKYRISRNIRKIELNKTLDMIYVTLYNKKMIKITNNQMYLNRNFRQLESLDDKRFPIGIQGKNYYITMRYNYIPNIDLFNSVIRGFRFSQDNSRLRLEQINI